MAHPLKLLDKMCKYEMDPLSIMEDTEQTRFCPQTDKVKPVYPPPTLLSEGYNNHNKTKHNQTIYIIYGMYCIPKNNSIHHIPKP